MHTSDASASKIHSEWGYFGDIDYDARSTFYQHYPNRAHTFSGSSSANIRNLQSHRSCLSPLVSGFPVRSKNRSPKRGSIPLKDGNAPNRTVKRNYSTRGDLYTEHPDAPKRRKRRTRSRSISKSRGKRNSQEGRPETRWMGRYASQENYRKAHNQALSHHGSYDSRRSNDNRSRNAGGQKSRRDTARISRRRSRPNRRMPTRGHAADSWYKRANRCRETERDKRSDRKRNSTIIVRRENDRAMQNTITGSRAEAMGPGCDRAI